MCILNQTMEQTGLYIFNYLLHFCVAVFKNPVCKVYRFQTTDSKWMLVREQMAECTLSFSVPIQLLRLYIQEDRHRYVIIQLEQQHGTGEYTHICRCPPDVTAEG